MDILCAYPNHNKPFHIYTNASDYQLGSCIMQDGQPVAYYSKKMNNAQHNYSTVDEELLSIVMTLREFWSMLLGKELHIHTDHKNIVNIGDSSQCRLRWISYVDEYGPKLHYVEGSANIAADTFSWLSRKDTPAPPVVGKKQPAEHSINEDDVDETPLDNYFSWVEDREMFECFKCLPDKECYLNLPDNMVDTNPKISENNRTQMMPCCNMQLNMRTNICINASVQLMISYATLSQEILQTIGKLHYQKACCNQQLSDSTK